jgi:hypothetical protein
MAGMFAVIGSVGFGVAIGVLNGLLAGPGVGVCLAASAVLRSVVEARRHSRLVDGVACTRVFRTRPVDL